jgi:hypothetical protein
MKPKEAPFKAHGTHEDIITLSYRPVDRVSTFSMGRNCPKARLYYNQ